MNDSNVATPITVHLRPPVRQLLRSWHRVFPGDASQVREARRFLAGCLAGCAAADDAITCLSELAANAVLHSNSRLPGGSFTVHAQRDAAGRLRIEVVDQGGPWSPARTLTVSTAGDCSSSPSSPPTGASPGTTAAAPPGLKSARAARERHEPEPHRQGEGTRRPVPVTGYARIGGRATPKGALGSPLT